MIDLSPNYLATVKTILAQHVPECEVWVFGSRTTWTAKDSSDLDLAVVGEGPLDWRTLGRLKESFEESDLPMRVDVLDWYGISESFREVIERAFTIVKEKARGAEAKSDWRQTTLDKLGRIVTGKTPSSRNPEYFGGGTQFVTPRDFNGRRRIESTERYLTTSGENAVKSARIPSGAVMVSCIGSDMGKSAITVEPCVTNQQINSIIVDSDFDPLFVYYDLSSRKDEIRASAGGSAQPILNKSAFGQLPITIPPLAEQQAISHVLGGLDDKIELNRRMNETLEEMARALFKSWFVDFDPVRAKMEGRWRRGESLPGLPAEHYDLFPERMVPSELGEIPEGWEVKALEYYVTLNPESWSRSNTPKEVEYVDLSNTKWGVIETTQHFLWEGAPSRARRVLRAGDTIVGTVRPGNGSYSLVGVDGLTGSTGFALLRPIHNRYRELVYLAATSRDNIEWLAQRADGAAYPAIRPELVGETQVPIPTAHTEVLDWFATTRNNAALLAQSSTR